MTHVLEVVDIVEDTQAQDLGLKRGDIIYEYDGQRIYQFDELVEASTRDIGPAPVEMIVLRDGARMRLYLQRDFIGVRVRNKTMPQSALPAGLQ